MCKIILTEYVSCPVLFVVQLDQSEGLLSLYHLCNSEIILWGASLSLKNMPNFVASIGRGCSTTRMKENLSRRRQSHLTFLYATSLQPSLSSDLFYSPLQSCPRGVPKKRRFCAYIWKEDFR